MCCLPLNSSLTITWKKIPSPFPLRCQLPRTNTDELLKSNSPAPEGQEVVQYVGYGYIPNFSRLFMTHATSQVFFFDENSNTPKANEHYSLLSITKVLGTPHPTPTTTDNELLTPF